MFTVLLENVKMDPLSLEHECLHVVRAIMYLVWTLEGHKRPYDYALHTYFTNLDGGRGRGGWPRGICRFYAYQVR